MAYHPKNRKPFGLTLNYLIKKDLWQTSDYDGIKYNFPHSLLEGLKNHFKNNADVLEWYRQLPDDDKKKVARLNLPAEDLNYSDGDFIE